MTLGRIPLLVVFLCPIAWAQFVQQSGKLTGADSVITLRGVQAGSSVAISADGSTATMGGPNDNGGLGAVWIFTRNGGTWSQQGTKIVGAGADGSSGSVSQGAAVALSADGNTLLLGAPGDYVGGPTGAFWVFTRNGGTWSQQIGPVVGTGAIFTHYLGSDQGAAVALSGDGNTALVGAPADNEGTGAVWTFTRTNGVWTQQGTGLYVSGTKSFFGASLALSADGTTALVGRSVFTRNKVFEIFPSPWRLLHQPACVR